MNQDLETGIQKLKELKDKPGRISSDDYNIIINLLTQAKDYQEEKDKRSIVWSVEDFISQAESRWELVAFLPTNSIYQNATKWQDVYDESMFENALYEMIRKHDCNNGITWDSINFYLDEYCLKKEKDESST